MDVLDITTAVAAESGKTDVALAFSVGGCSRWRTLVGRSFEARFCKFFVGGRSFAQVDHAHHGKWKMGLSDVSAPSILRLTGVSMRWHCVQTLHLG